MVEVRLAAHLSMLTILHKGHGLGANVGTC